MKNGTTRIDAAFQRLAAEKKKGFIAYITAGDPNLTATRDIVLRLEDEGVDLLELGLPFSDPLADGPVNQASAARALAAGTNMHSVLECVASIRKRSEIPLLCYSYMNPLHALGFHRITGKARMAGVDGFLLLDLPVEEARECHDILNQHHLNHVYLVTPTSPVDRIKKIGKASTGFVYCVSRTGVTGMQESLDKDAHNLVRTTQRHCTLPVALGFGISNPAQARAAAKYADAIVIGSAIVKRFNDEANTAQGRKQAAQWVGKLVKAVKEL